MEAAPKRPNGVPTSSSECDLAQRWTLDPVNCRVRHHRPRLNFVPLPVVNDHAEIARVHRRDGGHAINANVAAGRVHVERGDHIHRNTRPRAAGQRGRLSTQGRELAGERERVGVVRVRQRRRLHWRSHVIRARRPCTQGHPVATCIDVRVARRILGREPLLTFGFAHHPDDSA